MQGHPVTQTRWYTEMSQVSDQMVMMDDVSMETNFTVLVYFSLPTKYTTLSIFHCDFQ